MKIKLSKVIYVVFILLGVFLINAFLFPRREYKIIDKINEKIVIRLWNPLNEEDNVNYLLNINTEQYNVYTGSYKTNTLIQYSPVWGVAEYSPDKKYYIKDLEIYKGDTLLSTYPKLTVTRKFRYWTKDGKYLIAIDNSKKKLWLLWFDLWWPAIKIINLETWDIQQIYLYNSANKNLRITDIIWITE